MEYNRWEQGDKERCAGEAQHLVRGCVGYCVSFAISRRWSCRNKETNNKAGQYSQYDTNTGLGQYGRNPGPVLQKVAQDQTKSQKREENHKVEAYAFRGSRPPISRAVVADDLIHDNDGDILRDECGGIVYCCIGVVRSMVHGRRLA